jgi:outer membrane protein, heavy metal efflux system
MNHVERMPLMLTLLLLWPLAAAADERALSLDDAVEQALEQAPEVNAQTSGLEAAQALVESAGRLPDPELVVGVDNLPVTGPDAYSITDDFMTMRKIGVMQEFPRAAKRRLQHDWAAAEADLAGAQLAQTRLDVARQAAQAWIGRSTAETALQELLALEPEVELGAVAARAAVAAGRASSAEGLAAEAAAARLANRILETQGEARRARSELARWIGVDADRPLAAMPALDRLPTAPEALLETMHRHGALLPFESQLAAARADVELARAERRPDWSAELAYAERGSEFSDMVSLEFRIGLPLFARHRQNPAIAARGAELRRLEAERDSEVRMHTAELKQMLIDWERLGAQLGQVERELLPLSRERSRAALAAYRAGRADLRLALDAFADAIELLLERAALQNERGRAWAYLRYLEPEQVQP